MADNIVGGLFGMTPESLQAQRNAQLEQQASNFVNNYGDQGAMFGYKLGATLGRGIGGMLGAQDPEMQRIQQRQQMMQGIDMADPQSLLKAAQAANAAGDAQAAQALYGEYQKAAQAGALLSKTQAETTKALRETDPDKVRIAKAVADSKAKAGTAEWNAAFNEALNTQIAQRGASTPVTIQEQQLIGSLEDALAKDPSGNSIDPKLLNQARFVIGKLKQPKSIVDSMTGEYIQVPGANVNELAPNLASFLFGGGAVVGQPSVEGQVPVAGQPPKGPVPYGTTTLPTPKSEAIKAKEIEALASSIDTINNDLSNVSLALERAKPSLSTGWGAWALGKVPETDAKAFINTVNSVKSAEVFEQLKALKEQSRTGASGLGSVTEKEITYLESRLRALDPESKTIVEDLKFVQDYWQKLQKKMQLKQQGQVPMPSAAAPPKSTEDIISRAMAHPSAKGYSREQIIAGLRKAGKI